MNDSNLKIEALEKQVAYLTAQNEILRNSDASNSFTNGNQYQSLFYKSVLGYAFCEIIFKNDLPVNFVLSEVNPALEEILGQKNIIGKNLCDVLVCDKNKKNELFEKLSSIAINGEAKRIEFYFDKMDLWLSMLIICPEKKHLIATFKNITEKKKIEESLKNSEEKFRILFEQAAVGVAQIDTQTGKFIKINKKYSEIIGYTNNEIINLDFQTITFPSDLQPDLENMELLKTGVINEFTMEKRLIHKTGSIIWVSLTVSGMWAKGNTPDFHIAVVSDITQQKKSELELKKLSIAVEQCPVIIAITDTEGTIEYVNPAFCKITGYNLVEVIGKNQRVLKSEKTPTNTFVNLWSTLNAGKVWNGEFVNRKKDGSLYFEEAIISPVFDENYQIANYIAIKNDISEKKLQQDIIERTNNQLRELNAAKDKFFSIIAHDLKNPFNAITGFSTILLSNIETLDLEKIKTYISYIHSSSVNTYKLLENLLDWSSSQTGLFKFTPTKFSLNSLLNETIHAANDLAANKNILINCEIPNNVSVYADRNMINTVVRNLITNAIKFTHNNGQILIIVAEKSQIIEISVHDNGIGMNECTLEKIFSLTEKTNTPGTNDEKGTGLGLILCKEFVTKHNGEIWVESELGVGSKFVFTIPKIND